MTARHDTPEPQLAGLDLPGRVAPYVDELVAFRRDLHAHPELSWAEVRTTRLSASACRPPDWTRRGSLAAPG